jgi:hypothetical protein
VSIAEGEPMLKMAKDRVEISAEVSPFEIDALTGAPPDTLILTK